MISKIRLRYPLEEGEFYDFTERKSDQPRNFVGKIGLNWNNIRAWPG